MAVKVYDRFIADYGVWRSELLLKRLRCNVEQVPRLTAVSKVGDAAGFGGGGVCGRDAEPSRDCKTVLVGLFGH